MKTSLPGLLLFLLFPVLLKAQSNFKKGFVVTPQGDTLRGFIDYREWHQTPAAFAFKASAEAKETRDFTPENARYVGIENLEAFVRYRGPVSQDKVVLPDISTGIDTSTSTRTVFLKVLQTGPNVSVYAYRDPVKTRFYLQHHDQPIPEELVYRIYYKVQDAREQSSKPELTMQSKQYIGQLWLAAAKYQAGTPAFKSQIELINYSEPDILRIARKINGLGKEKKSRTQAAGPRTTFFVGTGVNSTTVKITGMNVLTAHYTWDEASSMEKRTFINRQETKSSPRLAAGIDVAPFPNTRKLLLRGELAFTASSFKFSNIHTLRYPDREMLHEFTFDQAIVSVAPQLIYNLYNASQFKFYLGAGAAYNVSFYPENTLNVKNLGPGADNSRDARSDNYMSFEKTWVNFPLRAGVLLYKKLDLSLIYWTPVDIAFSRSYKAAANSIHLGLNYAWN